MVETAPRSVERDRTPDHPAARAGPRVDLWDALLVVAIGMVLAWVWSVHSFATQDGPVHVGVARVLASWGDVPEYRSYFRLSLDLDPNLLAVAGLTALVRGFSTATATKLLVSGLIVGFLLSGRYALRGARRDAGPLVLALVLLSVSWYLHMGLFNFVSGLACWFLVVGFWLRHRPLLGRRSIVGLSLLLLLAYTAHLAAFAAAIVTLAVMVVADSIAAMSGPQRGGGVRSAGRDLWRRLWPLAIAAVPSGALTLAYVARDQGSSARSTSAWLAVRKTFTLGWAIPSFDRREAVAAALLAAVIAVAVAVVLLDRWRHDRRFRGTDGLLVAGVFFVVLVMTVPDRTAGGWLVVERVSVFPVLLALLWLATSVRDRRILVAVGCTGLLVTVAVLALRRPALANDDRERREVATLAPLIPEGRTVLRVTWFDSSATQTPRRYERYVQPLAHYGAEVVADRRAIDIVNEDAVTGYFPIVYRDDHDPYDGLVFQRAFDQTSNTDPPPEVDIAAYEASTGDTIEYVLVLGMDVQPGFDADKIRFQDQLAADGFQLVKTTSPHHLARLYRRVQR